MIEFNSGSNDHLSWLFFGGRTQVSCLEPVLNEDGSLCLYKSGIKVGQIKTKKVQKEIIIQGLGLNPISEWKTKKEGIYQTNETVLNTIAKKKETDSAEIAQLILDIRGLKKLISTYYEGTVPYIYPDEFIHPQFSHCGYGDGQGGTDTGRLSCTKPNVQNQPRKDSAIVKQHFVSRYAEGKLINADFSQLEVVAFAELTEDLNLCQVLCNGLDIHKDLVSELDGISYEKVKSERRTAIKPCTFNVIYGGGAKRLSMQSGLREEECRKFIIVFYKRYPRAKQWQESQISIVNKQGWYKDPMGRRYYFKKRLVPDFLQNEEKSRTGYNPPDIKNWKVQGFATAGLVPMMIGKFWREKALHNTNKYVMINTVHDSLILDCKKEFLEQASSDLDILCNMDVEMKRHWDYDWTVPVKIDKSEAENWWDLK